MSGGRVAAWFALWLAFVAWPAAAEPTAPLNTGDGAIVGTRADGLHTYLGIPYAAPPVGALRWRAPQPVAPWQGVKDASHYAAACAQTADWITHPKSEDCLYLNVWSPAKHATTVRLPVIVWIHGGGYYGGTAAQPLYNGSRLARHGAVVVTLNYRLGIFGFFAHPELSAESPDRASGNQGILDQIAALRWVKANIARFGGDPQRVTIVGESAGGESVALLVASPLAHGLFQRAIAESGNDALPLDASENQRFTRQAAEAEGAAIGQLADLRALGTAALQKQAWTPRTFVDGHLLREDLTTLYRNHRQNDVPLLVGWNAEEGKDLAPEILGTGDFSAANYNALVAKLLGHAPSAAVLTAYPGATDTQAKVSLPQLTNDWWGWRMARWAALQARHGRAPAYVYFFAHRPAPPATPCGYGCGAGHGAEIQYVFDNLDLDQRAWRPADRQLAERMAATWVNFARSGQPNGSGLPQWPAYDGSNATVQRIGDETDALPDFSLFR
ncbi:carboxylesterase family protein [Duganella sp. FT134W]|uniref:Carboxylic ester hydrolase n=1 Tax=Duganella margarita TaxID=2692170 RepID=A0A7X4GWB2_9BURK|nr:carboxylesterase family protein [Duganella margarita]MYM70902.1 carboxylesterase family protein [Duganella margarita]